MPSVTSWSRIEPVPVDPAMPGFAARVADPLWLLLRQAQLGEFAAEDAGSPVRVEVTAEVNPLTRFRPEGDGGGQTVPLDARVPLEYVVQAEQSLAPYDERSEAMAGARFLAVVGEQLHEPLVTAYGWEDPAEEPDSAAGRRLRVLRRRVPEPRKLAEALTDAEAAGDVSTAVPGLDRGDSGRLQAVREAASDWLAWYRRREGLAGAAPPSWSGGELGYNFSLAGPATTGERVLRADDVDGDELDWWSVDVGDGTLGASGDAGARTTTRSLLPTSVSYAGMPASRFWQLEPGEVAPGALSVAPEQLGALLYTEFALLYGDDFFLLPLAVPVGSVSTISSLKVTTTFGDLVDVLPAEQADVLAGRRPFRIFQPSVTRPGAPVPEARPWLVVLPGAVSPLHGPPVERLVLSLDEMADLAWAIELVMPDVDGRGREVRPSYEEPPATGAAPRLTYRPASAVPSSWHPLLRDAGSARPVLQVQASGLGGRLLAAGSVLHAEELGREGLTLMRTPRRARGADGRAWVWMGREVRPGRGESSSGLRFDELIVR